MWTNKDYDSLQLFSDYVDTHPDLYKDLGLDIATQESLLDIFYWRKVVDNDRFERFFRRTLSKHIWQYNQLLRIESVEFDPMVASYMERWVNRVGKNTVVSNNKGVNDRIVDMTKQNDGTRVETPDLTTKTEGTTTTDITDTVTRDLTNTSDTDTTTTGTGTVGVKTEDNSLKGILPDSSTYAAGFPDTMQWQYTSEQNETHGDNTTTRNVSDKTKVLGSGTEGGTVSTVGNNDAKTDMTNTTSGRSETTDSFIMKDTGTDKLTSTQDGMQDVTSNSTDKEIATGRAEAPQDMLDRARDYIQKTNAFVWLVKKLELSFMGVFEL